MPTSARGPLVVAGQALPQDRVVFHSCWQTPVAPLSPQLKCPVAQLPWKLARRTTPHSLGTVEGR